MFLNFLFTVLFFPKCTFLCQLKTKWTENESAFFSNNYLYLWIFSYEMIIETLRVIAKYSKFKIAIKKEGKNEENDGWSHWSQRQSVDGDVLAPLTCRWALICFSCRWESGWLLPTSVTLSPNSLSLPVLYLVSSVRSSSLQPHGLSPPGSSVHGDFPSNNTEVVCYALLQGIFQT